MDGFGGSAKHGGFSSWHVWPMKLSGLCLDGHGARQNSTVHDIQTSCICFEINCFLQSAHGASIGGGVEDATQLLESSLENRKGVLPSTTSTPNQTLSWL